MLMAIAGIPQKIEKRKGRLPRWVLCKWRRVVGAGVVVSSGVTALGPWWCGWAACRVSVV